MLEMKGDFGGPALSRGFEDFDSEAAAQNPVALLPHELCGQNAVEGLDRVTGVYRPESATAEEALRRSAPAGLCDEGRF